MNPENILNILRERFPRSVVEMEEMPDNYIPLLPDNWFEIATLLQENPDLQFDSLQCITGIDLAEVPKDKPKIPSVEKIWRVGDWFERETYDMYGIVFDGHRDHRRILLPDDWEGWPLRKDYETQETYHGIVVPKVKEGWE